MKQITFTFLFSLLVLNGFSQHVNQNSGWLMFLNSTKFSDKWGLHLDVQLRTEDNWDGVRNFLFRPGVTYYINKNSNATVGYLLTNTFLKNNGIAKYTLTEHRIWEQYVYTHKIKPVYVQHRFRLEQRFIETTGEDIFSQRFRYFVRFVLPLTEAKEPFVEGPFVALQNELFFNVQNKDKLNGKLFDQNRAYGAAGYRFSKRFDMEVGYLNQFIDGRSVNTINNAVQLAFYTRF
ncbi:MAG: DUF2490 domain-containing protein [Candidatus Pedobacter colombiensis]|uniref:DUF2490 domain-containing protein n=1 Tax=Candidatus Pedobacter colombiensis TaxID=3121371 RepID=A0AAJ5W7V4_9SPHI|nr:DUF2490 domain-containing protein [Pedobacter sp.]WEK18806.1 MAG: DUF2490 domain-containing protein [Pedobacter sp.]